MLFLGFSLGGKLPAGLLDDESAEYVLRDSSERAYYRTGLAIDLAAQGNLKSQDLVRSAIRWSEESDDKHSVADSLARAGEVELLLGRPESCLQWIEGIAHGTHGVNVLEGDEPIIIAIGHKLCMQAHYQLGNSAEAEAHFDKAIEIATSQNLEDQKQKMELFKNAMAA